MTHMENKASDQIDTGLNEQQALYSRIDKLEEELREAKKTIAYYANMDNWRVSANKKNTQYIDKIESEDHTKHEDAGYKLSLGGKMARDYLEKYKD